MKQFNIINFATLDSTNKYAIKNINSLNDRDIIVADVQTSGRGRFERKWISDVPDNLYMSIVLKPQGQPDKLPLSNLTHLMAVSIVRSLEHYGINAQIKWPNDVQVDGKKISGILSQTSFTNMTLNGIVIGVGVNLNLDNAVLRQISQPATSLNLLLGKHIDNAQWANILLDNFFGIYDDFIAGGFSVIKDIYLAKCNSIGRDLKIHTVSGDIFGKAIGIDDNGTLMLHTSQGVIKVVEGES